MKYIRYIYNVSVSGGIEMTRNILLTSLDAPESDTPLRYYAAQGELGRGCCEALQRPPGRRG